MNSILFFQTMKSKEMQVSSEVRRRKLEIGGEQLMSAGM